MDIKENSIMNEYISRVAPEFVRANIVGIKLIVEVITGTAETIAIKTKVTRTTGHNEGRIRSRAALRISEQDHK